MRRMVGEPMPVTDLRRDAAVLPAVDSAESVVDAIMGLPAPVGLPHVSGIPDSYARVVATVFAIDPWTDFVETVKRLDLGDDYTREEVVRESLAHGEDRARQAHRLYTNAELEFRRWKRNNEAVFGAMWASAVASLQAEKDEKRRSKAITDSDVEHRVHELFPDEYRAAKDKEDQFELVVDHLKDIAKKWESRCYSLNTLAGRGRR
jgi:hypothetical protein